jgi:hypothetical protein
VSSGDTVEVSYGSVGRYAVSATAVKITDPPHLYRQSKSLNVTGLTYRAPDQIASISATVGGTSYSGEVFIYRSDPDGEIRSPVIVTDGFDPGNARHGRCLYSLFNRHNLLEEGLRKGWDFFVLDFSAGAGAIQGNAAVLVQLIQMVNGMKSGIAPVAVVGPSMGGLVSRYALLDMEAQGIDHEVAVFISFDSPQKGANIPYGDQLWVHYFSNNSPGALDGANALNSTAARQMLLYHAAPFAHVAPEYDTIREILLAPGMDTTTTISYPTPDPLHQGFFQELDSLGGFPSRPRLAAISNGSGFGIRQPAAPAQLLIVYEYGSSSVDIRGNSRALPDGANLTKLFEGKIDPAGLAKDRFRLFARSAVGYDSAPGGQRSTSAEIASAKPDLGDIVSRSEAECFIPTTSALAIETLDPFYNIAGDADILSKTPFDAIYYPVENEEHVCISEWNKEWIFDELSFIDRYRAALIATVLSPLT